MDRVIVYSGSTPRSTDFMQAENDAMFALGYVGGAAIGYNTWVDGLGCTPGTGLSVNILPGVIGSYQVVDSAGVALGGLPLDSRQIMKFGINAVATLISLVAPTTAGQSINYLIEAQFQEADDLPVVLPYYNSANPAVPFTGPTNTGTSQNTRRKQIVSLQLKAGASAVAGSQPTPGADAGWVPLWIVTVPYGAASILTNNISMASSAPFIGTKTQQQLTRLTANLTLYVSATGNDTTNNGLSPNVPFATLQAAANAIQTQYNLNGFGVQITLLGPSIFTSVQFSGLPTGYGISSFVSIVGSGSPGISSTSAIGAVSCINGASVTVSNVTVGGTNGLQASFGSIITIGSGVIFSTCSAGHVESNGGLIYINGNYTISGSAPSHFSTGASGQIIVNGFWTITLTGTPAFSNAFAVASSGQMQLNVGSSALTFSGSATGQRYLATIGGAIITNGSGASYLPGSTAGSASTGYYL